jgi:nitrite reductase/ring-hydroxylating ferredoxin subunit
MVFVYAASVSELHEGAIAGVNVNGKEVLLANVSGKIYAIGNICTHMGCKLSDSMIKDGSIRCICHKSMFDLRTGKVKDGPATKPEPVFVVKVDHGKIMVKV